MLTKLMADLDPVLGAATPEGASEALFACLKPFGPTSLQTRVYRRPHRPLTSEEHWQAGGWVTRIAKPGWLFSGEFNYICFECNPLLTAIREHRTRYRFSDFAPHGDRAFGAYWEAYSQNDLGDALCATSYGEGGMIASFHIGFPEADLAPEIAFSVQMAGLVLTEKLLEGANPQPHSGATLTPRERDCLAWVAEGKSDREISVILGISQATARFHVNNARKTLGAVNRAQAVAKMHARRLI